MIDISRQNILAPRPEPNEGLENPLNYFLKLLIVGVSYSFLIVSILGTIFGLIKLFFL